MPTLQDWLDTVFRRYGDNRMLLNCREILRVLRILRTRSWPRFCFCILGCDGMEERMVGFAHPKTGWIPSFDGME